VLDRLWACADRLDKICREHGIDVTEKEDELDILELLSRPYI